MTIVPKESIELVAQTIGITNLEPDVAAALAPDVEYRLREMIQESVKCMRHCRRTTLKTEDVDAALKLRNLDPIFGMGAGDSMRFKRAAGHGDLFYVDNKDVEFKEVVEAPLTKTPLDSSVMAHWLTVEGHQPAIPENLPFEANFTGKRDYKEDVPSDGRLPVKHVLSMELQLYFDKLTQITLGRSSPRLFKQALMNLATDSGLQPLVPYFTYFIANEVRRNLSNTGLLFALMRFARSLLQNRHLHIEPYLHQLMPSILTCLVVKRAGNRLLDQHWDLKNFTANIVACVCKRSGHIYHNLQPRVAKTLVQAFLDPSKTLAQHYGAIQGLVALGPSVVRLYILPNIEQYLKLLLPEMLFESQKNSMKRNEAWSVYRALLVAGGICMYERLKMSPGSLSPRSGSNTKNNAKTVSAVRNKRRASVDNIMQQQTALTKIGVDGAMGMMRRNSMPFEMHGAAVAGVGISTMSRQFQNSNAGVRVIKASTVLAHAWKEDIDAGQLVSKVFELFGESMLPFIPKPELNIFL